MNKIAKGFTLIELLIVIALLGALAVALLASLDPLEQIKKGTDTGVRNTVSEVASSFTRYASVQQGAFPVPTGDVAFHKITKTDATTEGQKAIQKIIATGELKPDFLTLAGDQLDKIWMTSTYSDAIQKVYICFQPTAKSFKADLNTKYVLGAVPGTMNVTATACDPVTGKNADVPPKDCYWCSQ